MGLYKTIVISGILKKYYDNHFWKFDFVADFPKNIDVFVVFGYFQGIYLPKYLICNQLQNNIELQ